jgi:hypothetical protein
MLPMITPFWRYLGQPQLFLSIVSENDLERRIIKITEHCSRNGTFCHIWGHSWEIDKMDAWRKLKNLFSVITTQFNQLTFGSNMEFFRHHFEK